MSETTEGSGPERTGTQENACQEEPRTTTVERPAMTGGTIEHGTTGNDNTRSDTVAVNLDEKQECGVETRRSFASVTVSFSFKDGSEQGLAIVRSSGIGLPVLGPTRVTLSDVGEKVQTLLREYEEACKAAERTIRPPARRTTTVKPGRAAPSATTAPAGTAGPSPAGKAQLSLI